MNILFATSEAVPIAKTGGLADVAGALPKALNKLGADTRVVLPKYGTIPAALAGRFEQILHFDVYFGWRKEYCGLLRAELEGVTYYLIDNERYFKRHGLYGYEDDTERFVFFCFAVMEAVRYMDFHPDIVHCHDWQTALIPFMLRTRYALDPAWAYTKSVFTIHNLKYQGVLGIPELQDLLGVGDETFNFDSLEFYGAASCMKGGLVYADKITTVSGTYAEEIKTEYYGERLDSLLRYRAGDLVGIVNGIDAEAFDPLSDAALHTPYRDSLALKRENKLALQRELGLPQSAKTPLIGIVSRLVEQKGFELIMATFEELLQEDVQFVVLGAGDHRYEHFFNDKAYWHPDKVKVWIGYDDSLARRIYAGSDMFAMPSQFEPCGLSQLIALRYLSVPIVRETGGLKDTVQAYNEYTGEGNGFSFANYNAHDYMHTVRRALAFYRDEKSWNRIVSNASKEDYSWGRSAKAYISLYTELLANGKEQ